MLLEDFYDYKNRLMEDILTDEEIVRLINEDVPFENAKSLMYKNVFPYEYVPETVQDGYTFICADVDVTASSGKTFLFPVMYIWVFSHRSQLRLPNGEGIRPDKLCSKIYERIKGSRLYGLGHLNLNAVKRFAPMTDYQGKVMTFNMWEVNGFDDEKRPFPVNRKKG